MIKKVLVTAFLLCFSSALFAAQSLQKLPELVAILNEVHQIDVKDQTDDSVVISWAVGGGRKLDTNSLKILKEVAGITEENEQWFFHVAVFCRLQEGKSEGQAMSKSQYKAEKMHNALQKLSVKGTVVESAGLGHEYNEDKVFLSISKAKNSAINKIAVQ